MLSRLYGILLPFFVSFLIAYILDPIVGFIQVRCRVRSRVVSVLLTLLLVVGGISALVATMMPTITRQVQAAAEGFERYIVNFDANRYLTEQQERLSVVLSNGDIERLLSSEEFRTAVKKIIPKIVEWITGGLSWLAEWAVVFIGLMYLLFLMIDFPRIRQSWRQFVPARLRPKVFPLVHDLNANMNAYFRGQALVALSVGILFSIGFTLIGLPMGIAMGLIVGMLNFVPYMQILGIPPCIILCLIESAQRDMPVWLPLLLLAIVFIVVQTIQDMVLVPRIMGKVTGLRPATILLSLSLWGAVLGVIGMIIALPVTSLIVSYYKHFVARSTSGRGALGMYRGRLRRVIPVQEQNKTDV